PVRWSDLGGAAANRLEHGVHAIDVPLCPRAFASRHPVQSTSTGIETVFCCRAQIFSVQMKNVSFASTSPCPADGARNAISHRGSATPVSTGRLSTASSRPSRSFPGFTPLALPWSLNGASQEACEPFFVLMATITEPLLPAFTFWAPPGVVISYRVRGSTCSPC